MPECYSNHEGGNTSEDVRRTRGSHDNAPARVLLALFGAGDLHRGRSVLDGEKTRCSVHVHHSFPFFHRVIEHGQFLRNDSCLDIPRKVKVQCVR